VESAAAALGRLLAGLPGPAPFLGASFALLLVLAGTLFAARRTTPVAFLRDRLDALLGAALAALLLAMVILSGLQILLRNLFDTGVPWIDPLLRHLVLLLAFTGAVAATGRKRHVQINVLARLLHGVWARVAGTAIAAIAAGTCLALSHAALELLRDEIEFGGTAFLDIPSWTVVAVFPAAFLVLAFRFQWLVFAEIAGEAPPGVETEELIEPEHAA
jgi:TRAP-type C4-dicarboxylate transport system permease small subunit